jgi:hypothetical protein
MFDRCSKDNTIDRKEALSEKFISILVAYDIPHDDAKVMETNFNYDDDGPGLMRYRYPINTVPPQKV